MKLNMDMIERIARIINNRMMVEIHEHKEFRNYVSEDKENLKLIVRDALQGVGIEIIYYEVE